MCHAPSITQQCAPATGARRDACRLWNKSITQATTQSLRSKLVNTTLREATNQLRVVNDYGKRYALGPRGLFMCPAKVFARLCQFLRVPLPGVLK